MDIVPASRHPRHRLTGRRTPSGVPVVGRRTLLLALVIVLSLTTLLHTPIVAQDAAPAATGTPPPAATDGQPPVITLPAALPPIAAVDGAGAVVDYLLPTATDDVSGPVPVGCDPPPGSLFPLGTTEVRCSAQDAAGNVAVVSLIITVTDQTPPALSQPASFTVTAPDASGAAVSFDLPTAVDTIDGPVAVACDVSPGTFLPVGDTTVTCTAADSAGNTASVSFVISVLAPPEQPVATDPPTEPPTPIPTDPPTIAPTAPPEPSPTAAERPTEPPTATPSPTPSPRPTGTTAASPTPPPTQTPSAIATVRTTPSPTPTKLVPTPSPTATIAPTPVMRTPTATPSPTLAATHTPTPVLTTTLASPPPPAFELPEGVASVAMEGDSGGPLGGLANIWRGAYFPISQEFGHTPFSIGNFAMYAYGLDYGLDGYEHPGIDIAMPAGTWLYSPVNGTVMIAGGVPYYTYYGNGAPGVGELMIQEDDGNQVILGHMSAIAVQAGQRVVAGQFVGLSGGDNGDHLHLETRQLQPDGSYRIVDPRQSFLAAELGGGRLLTVTQVSGPLEIGDVSGPLGGSLGSGSVRSLTVTKISGSGRMLKVSKVAGPVTPLTPSRKLFIEKSAPLAPPDYSSELVPHCGWRPFPFP